MKILSVVAMILLLSASFCAKNGPVETKPKLVVASIDSTEKEKPKYVVLQTNVISGDSLMFTAKKIKKSATIIIPMADMLCQLDTGDSTIQIEGITYLFIPLVRKDKMNSDKEWTSRIFIINKHNKKTIYEYSAYIHEKMEMAEGKSSPKIIVDP